MIEFFLLIDLGSNYSYVNPNLVDKCGLRKEVHAESWLVQSATGTKKRFHHFIRSYEFEMNYMPMSSHLNLIPLGSYSMLMGMDWFYLDKRKVDCYGKAIECLNDNWEKRIL